MPTNEEAERIALWVEAYGMQAVVKEPFDCIADLIRRLLTERDEALAKANSMLTIPEVAQVIAVGPEAGARNKALDEAAERAGRLLGYYDGKAVTAAILALKTQEPKP